MPECIFFILSIKKDGEYFSKDLCFKCAVEAVINKEGSITVACTDYESMKCKVCEEYIK